MTPAGSKKQRGADSVRRVAASQKAALRPTDRHWQTLTNKMARSSREQRVALFALYEDEVVAFVKTKGLV